MFWGYFSALLPPPENHVFGSVGPSVCQFVSNFTQKLLNGLDEIFSGGQKLHTKQLTKFLDWLRKGKE